MLVVLKSAGRNVHGKNLWTCNCDCGAITTAVQGELLSGHKKSCGCLRYQATTRRHGMTDTPEHHAWKHMRGRCNNPRHKNYALYGGRGIEVRYSAFEDFLADVGQRPAPGYTVDRIDVNGHYERGNCRWATRLEQGSNRRNNHYLTFNGRTQHIAAWARELGIDRLLIRQRIGAYGWSVERALTEQVNRK